MDFVSDALVSKRKVRVLTVIDDCSREVLAAYADFSLSPQKVVDVLETIALERPLPRQIRPGRRRGGQWAGVYSR